MSHFTGLDHLDIVVENFDEMVTFLTSIGFEHIRDTGERGTVELRFPGGPEQPFIELRRAKGKDGKVRAAGLRHMALRTTDFDKAYNDLKSKGYKFRDAPHYVKDSGRTVVSMTDPDGQQLQFVSPETK